MIASNKAATSPGQHLTSLIWGGTCMTRGMFGLYDLKLRDLRAFRVTQPPPSGFVPPNQLRPQKTKTEPEEGCNIGAQVITNILLRPI